MSLPSVPRAIDHLVLPTAGLAGARQRLTLLGFSVAPDAEHPFGTGNACVFLADGTYLEPLAVLDEQKLIEAMRNSNVFAARQAAFQFRRGAEGFSAVVFASGDAAADHARFQESGWSAGPPLEFSRDFIDASGNRDTASFKLAFAGDLRAPDCLMFTCQRVNAPKVDRQGLQQHANGVVRLRLVVLAAPRPSSFGLWLTAVSGATVAQERPGDALVLGAANADLMLMSNEMLQRDFGGVSGGDQGLEARVVVFGVDNLRGTEEYLRANRVAYERHRGRVIVRPAPGQGAIFAFEDNK